ncbi:hypothetical protein Acr_00g0030710 [Actinidia rufa]|uniref:Uncharacterized protein n=1 Tax=Actinidia rufa TaxID=165716 RepID=A0A7J0DEW9_9ERIC|nr:hypothetical protein Acr_00g0030710 [Actinidia rufa]
MDSPNMKCLRLQKSTCGQKSALRWLGLRCSKHHEKRTFSVTIHKGEMVIDAFEDIQVTWQMICTETEKSSTDYSAANVERRSIELSFHNKNREKVLSSYLPYVLELSKAITEANTVVKLHSLGNCKGGVNLDHPSTFDTLAMDPKLKNDLVDDLNSSVRARAGTAAELSLYNKLRQSP